MCYNRFRYYQPETGRYISEDPIKLLGGFNVFAYIGDSNAWVDLLGLSYKRGYEYVQAREFDADGNAIKDIDFTDHNRPKEHTNPHQHRYIDNSTGGTKKRGKGEPLDFT